MKEILIQLVTAYLGALGFGLLFGIRKEHLFLASLGGMIAWGIYLGVHALIPSMFLGNLCASIFAIVYADFLARRRKCPSTLFVIIGIVPMVPGSLLYYTMEAAATGNLEAANQYGHQTLVCALAIAGGIGLATVFRDLRTPKR